jgi:hypothetical protein
MAKKPENLDGMDDRGENYKPFLLTHQTNSQGLSIRVNGWKTNRIHHLLSRLELFYFYNLEWFYSVKDIREQFLLNLSETVAISKDIGVRHAGKSRSVHYAMTTDFIITIEKGIGIGELARTVKPSSELSDPSVIEKFEIERIYWEEKGINWGIVTEKEIDTDLALNIELIHEFNRLETLTPLTQTIVDDVQHLLTDSLQNQDLTLTKITDDCDAKLKLPTGLTLTAIKHLLATNQLKANMFNRINPDNKISEIGLTTVNKEDESDGTISEYVN